MSLSGVQLSNVIWFCFSSQISVSLDKMHWNNQPLLLLFELGFHLFYQIPCTGIVYIQVVKFHSFFYHPAINFQFVAYKFFSYTHDFRFINWYFHTTFQATEKSLGHPLYLQSCVWRYICFCMFIMTTNRRLYTSRWNQRENCVLVAPLIHHCIFVSNFTCVWYNLWWNEF